MGIYNQRQCLFDRGGNKLVPNKHYNYTIVSVKYTEDQNEMYANVKEQLSRVIAI
jgi:hypothetical protein